MTHKHCSGAVKVPASIKDPTAISGDVIGAGLVAAVQASSYREIEIEPVRSPLPVRDVVL